MLPLRDNIPTRRFPIVCVVLIVLNVLVFLADQASSVNLVIQTESGRQIQQTMGGLSYRYAMIPAYVSGQSSVGLTPLFLHPAWLTIFTSMFLHANWLHIGGNMLYLWIFGNNIEDVLGRGKFLLFYLLCGVGAAGVQILSDPTSPIPNLGASGAIAGVMGAYLILYPAARILSIVPLFGIVGTLLEVPAIIVIGFWIILQVVDAQFLSGGDVMNGGVAYLAHVGGFGTGIVLIWLLGGRRLLPPPAPPDFDEGYTPRRWVRKE